MLSLHRSGVQGPGEKGLAKGNCPRVLLLMATGSFISLERWEELVRVRPKGGRGFLRWGLMSVQAHVVLDRKQPGRWAWVAKPLLHRH